MSNRFDIDDLLANVVVLQENEHNHQQNDRLVEKQSIIDNIRRVFENKIG